MEFDSDKVAIKPHFYPSPRINSHGENIGLSRLELDTTLNPPFTNLGEVHG
jgi:hypothetical protein